jgi:hypothetical protein
MKTQVPNSYTPQYLKVSKRATKYIKEIIIANKIALKTHNEIE